MTWPCWIWRRRRRPMPPATDRKSTRLNSSHLVISYAVFCLKKNRADGSRLRVEADLQAGAGARADREWRRTEDLVRESAYFFFLAAQSPHDFPFFPPIRRPC